MLDGPRAPAGLRDGARRGRPDRAHLRPLADRGLEVAGRPRARQGIGDDLFTLRSLKGFADGSIGSSTALFFEPYADDPQQPWACPSDHKDAAARMGPGRRRRRPAAQHPRDRRPRDLRRARPVRAPGAHERAARPAAARRARPAHAPARLRAARAAGRDRLGAALPRHRRRPLRGEADRPAAHAEHVRLPQLPRRRRAHWPSAPTGPWRRSIPMLGHRRGREPADARRQEPRAAGSRSRRSRWPRRSAPTRWTPRTPRSWRTAPARSRRGNTRTWRCSTATCSRCRPAEIKAREGGPDGARPAGSCTSARRRSRRRRIERRAGEEHACDEPGSRRGTGDRWRWWRLRALACAAGPGRRRRGRDFSGHWTLNKDQSEDARKKMADAREGGRGKGPIDGLGPIGPGPRSGGPMGGGPHGGPARRARPPAAGREPPRRARAPARSSPR